MTELPEYEPHNFLACAVEKENDYNWIAAIEYHEKGLDYSLQHKDLLRTGEFAERIGYSYYRAAMQAKSHQEFKRKINFSIKSYERAQEFYEELPSKKKSGRELRSKAVVKYLRYWLNYKFIN